MEIGHQNYDKKFELELELFFNLGPPERQCAKRRDGELKIYDFAFVFVSFHPLPVVIQ